MNKLHILLVFGGQSSEHDVSLMSARNVFSALNQQKYRVSLCYITPDGRWKLVDQVTPVDDNTPEITPVLGAQGFMANGEFIKIDVLFPVLHGRGGEDGTVQGLAELIGVPYVGPSLLAAAVTMDKDMTKRLVAAAGVPVVPWHTITMDQPRPDYAELAEELGAVFFVKPSRAGSSVGVSKVSSASDLSAALDEAFRHDKAVLIEQAIDAREIELAVLGGDSSARVSGAGEIIPGEEFYSYDDKYSDASTSQAVIPAAIEATTLEKLRSYALIAHHATAGQGMARVDFFLDSDGQIFLNEINSIPGFTNISMYPKLWQEAGLTPDQLVDELVELACY